MFSDKTLHELIYPPLRAVIFIFCSLLLAIFITPFLGTGPSYHSMLVKDGIAHFIWVRFIVLSTVTLIAFAMLYGLGRLCRRKTTKNTYFALFITLLAIAIWASMSFLNSNLWNYPLPNQM